MKKRRLIPVLCAAAVAVSLAVAVQAVQAPPQRKGARIPRRPRLRPVQRQERKEDGSGKKEEAQALPRMRSS